MWGRRRKRGSQLSRQLALGLLEDAMARAEQQHEAAEPEPVPYPRASNPPPDVPAARTGLGAEDVPVDNSAAPGPQPAGEDPDPVTPQQQELPTQRTGENTRRGSFG
jgi:hypothetical protein